MKVDPEVKFQSPTRIVGLFDTCIVAELGEDIEVFQSPTRIVGLFDYTILGENSWDDFLFQSPTRIVGLFDTKFGGNGAIPLFVSIPYKDCRPLRPRVFMQIIPPAVGFNPLRGLSASSTRSSLFLRDAS